jgi:hypothetical protein
MEQYSYGPGSGTSLCLDHGTHFVIPPPAVLYLLHQNKKWKDNFSTFADFLDFKRLNAGNGLEVISMKEFLSTVAAKGLLSRPLPEVPRVLAQSPRTAVAASSRAKDATGLTLVDRFRSVMHLSFASSSG